MTIKITALAASIGAAVAFMPFATQAEITVLKQDPQAGNPLSRLNFTVGGSIRPQFQNMTGNDGANGYKRNGFDGGTRFRFAADYYLFDDISWISYYELGVNIPAVFDWDNHYAKGATDTTRRMLYTGFKSATWGNADLRSTEQHLLRCGGRKNRYLGLRYDRSGAGQRD